MEEDQGMVEDQGAEGDVGQDPGQEEDQGVEDTGQTGSNDQINDNTVDLKKGTYSGRYVLIETDLDSAGESDLVGFNIGITVTEKQVLIDHLGNSSYEVMTFNIEQTDMAGRIQGKGYAPPDFVVRPDLGPTGQHLLLLEFHAGAGEAKGKIWLHYVNQRIGYAEFVATKN